MQRAGGLKRPRVDSRGGIVDPRERPTFDAFARARLAELLRFGYALTGDKDTAADLVQDALVRTGLRWSTVRASDPEGYVRRVMVNTQISWWRRRRREQLTASPPDVGYEPPSPDYSMWALLATLPPRQRAVLVLRYYEDLSEVQIAAVLGCSVGTVKSQAARAIGKLRTTLTREQELQ
jgi:RNA polymerase sigma-70 factor (sigma-E family)